MPIKRYARYLAAFGQLEKYEQLLFENFNPATLDGLMCRNTLSVSWDGKLYDCDFNQMLGMSLRATEGICVIARREASKQSERCGDCFGAPPGGGAPRNDSKELTIFDAKLENLNQFSILTADHCFGCTAGCGSSCQGALS